MTPLEMLALLAVLAVLLVGFVRSRTRKRERRRTPRELDPDYSPLQLYRTGTSRPIGLARPATVFPERPVPAPEPPMPRAEPSTPAPSRRLKQSAADPPARVEASPRPAGTTPRRQSTERTEASEDPRSREPTIPAARKPRAAASSAASRSRQAGRTAALADEVRPTKSAPVEMRLAEAPAQAADGTLQLLPGRLEVLSGLGQREEIRFVRVGNLEPAVTFGRSVGEPHLHVRLESPTVSRLHARMRRTDAGWLLSNLSLTNPVVVNGVAMTNGHEHSLVDGDRIEMGEVVFQFRAG